MLDTRNKYNRYKTFIETDCIMCGETMIIPKALKDNIKCCSEYCSQRRLTLLRLKGKYVLCDMCNKPKWIMPKEYKKNKHFCSRKCDNMYRKIVEPLGQTDRETTGRKKYYGENWHRQRRKVRKRDNYTCQKCGITEDEYGKELSVHHIIPFVMFDNYLEANKEENLISVCVNLVIERFIAVIIIRINLIKVK